MTPDTIQRIQAEELERYQNPRRPQAAAVITVRGAG